MYAAGQPRVRALRAATIPSCSNTLGASFGRNNPTAQTARDYIHCTPRLRRVGPSISMEGNNMGIIWTILIGFIVGLLAKMITPGRDPSGFFITAIIGIIGSIVATYGGQALGLYRAGEPAG